jgi:hypothetical protein
MSTPNWIWLGVVAAPSHLELVSKSESVDRDGPHLPQLAR